MAAVPLRCVRRGFLLFRTVLCSSRPHKSATIQIAQQYMHTTRLLQSGNEINFTQSCIKQMKKILERDEFLRIAIEGGGCSGFQYKIEIDTSVQDDDRTFITEGGKVVVDIDSLKLIEGSTVDFQEELIKSSFVVKQNPNAGKGCSCGSSFTVKI